MCLFQPQTQLGGHIESSNSFINFLYGSVQGVVWQGRLVGSHMLGKKDEETLSLLGPLDIANPPHYKGLWALQIWITDIKWITQRDRAGSDSNESGLAFTYKQDTACWEADSVLSSGDGVTVWIMKICSFKCAVYLTLPLDVSSGTTQLGGWLMWVTPMSWEEDMVYCVWIDEESSSWIIWVITNHVTHLLRSIKQLPRIRCENMICEAKRGAWSYGSLLGSWENDRKRSNMGLPWRPCNNVFMVHICVQICFHMLT